MSRVAKAPVTLPNGTSVALNGQQVEVNYLYACMIWSS